MAQTKKRKRETGKAKFDRIFKERIKKEHGREDPVAWLSEEIRRSYGFVSRLLNHSLPRRTTAGHENLTWRMIKEKLTAEEIRILEGVPCN